MHTPVCSYLIHKGTSEAQPGGPFRCHILSVSPSTTPPQLIKMLNTQIGVLISAEAPNTLPSTQDRRLTLVRTGGPQDYSVYRNSGGGESTRLSKPIPPYQFWLAALFSGMP